jgi:hypothetical protein
MPKWSGSIALVAAVAVATGLAQTSAGHALLQRTGLYEMPASYTALAFSAPASLPLHLHSAHAAVNVSFNIRNVSDAPRSYQWTVLEIRHGRSKQSFSSDIRVPADGKVTVHRSVSTRCIGGRIRIAVMLAIPAESIGLMVTCRAPEKRNS